MDNIENRMYIVTTHGERGWFAVIMQWNPKQNGFWEPYQSSPISHQTRAQAEHEADIWAYQEDLPREIPSLH